MTELIDGNQIEVDGVWYRQKLRCTESVDTVSGYPCHRFEVVSLEPIHPEENHARHD